MVMLTDTQSSIQQMARDFTVREVLPVSPVLESGDLETLRGLWQKMAELGLTGLPLPEAYGGAGLDYLSYFLVLTEIAKVSAALATALSVHVSLVGLPLTEVATETQQAAYLPRLAAGETIGAFALTEPDAGSDAGSGTCRAEQQAVGSYRLNGSKIFITNALLADVFLVTARTNREQPGPRGLSAFIVERGDPGFAIHPGEAKMGLCGGDWGELTFTDTIIPANRQLGPKGHGFKVFMNSLNVGRIGIASVSLGLAEACLSASTAYARQREQFGKPIAAFQAIQFKLADMATGIEAARGLIHNAARLRQANQPHVRQAAMAKLYASELANRCATEAVQIHGGYGYTKDFPVERYFRDARVMTLFEGTSEVQHLVIARELLKA